MSDGKSAAFGGVSIVGLLGVLFVALKLTGYITWSWLWVTLPFWGGIASAFALLAIILTIGTIFFIVGTIWGDK